MSDTTVPERKRPDAPATAFDWDEDQWRDIGQRMLDIAIAASTGWDSRPAAPVDGDDITGLDDSLPSAPIPIDRIVERLRDEVIPGAIYNGHPRFLAYITSSPTPVGVVGDLIASAMNSNVGLCRVAGPATRIELQTIDWIKEMLGFPSEAEGVFLSGGQMANVAAHAVIRDSMTPWDVRHHGIGGPDGDSPKVRIYASEQIHYCHQQAAELLGLGRDAIRLVPVDDDYRMRMDSLQAMIDEDRAAGHLPVAIVGTAGTVGTGAVDPLGEISRLAYDQDLWFHVDGAYGAFAAIAPSAEADLRHIADADSVACDPHKWLYAPIDAGVVLVRQPGRLAESFAFHAAYLHGAGDPMQVDLLERSPENSRPFRALKVWLALQAYGRDGYRDMIEHNIQTAAHMARQIESTPGLALAAPRGLSIVCWRVQPESELPGPDLDRLQHEVIAELQRRGIAIVSNATLGDGRVAIRSCIVNFRTTPEDVEAVVAASAEIGIELAGRLSVRPATPVESVEQVAEPVESAQSEESQPEPVDVEIVDAVDTAMTEAVPIDAPVVIEELPVDDVPAPPDEAGASDVLEDEDRGTGSDDEHAALATAAATDGDQPSEVDAETSDGSQPDPSDAAGAADEEPEPVAGEDADEQPDEPEPEPAADEAPPDDAADETPSDGDAGEDDASTDPEKPERASQ